LSLLNWLAAVFIIWILLSLILVTLMGAIWYRWHLDDALYDIFSPNVEAPHDAL
jgi:hypothetical protein